MATSAGAGVSSGVPFQSLSTQFLNLIKSAIGTPYLWGGTNPFKGGADCSGLVYWAAGKLGLKVPRTSQEQWASLPHVPASQVQPGDLVFFAGSDGTMSAPGHVGIVTGPGRMIDDPYTGVDVRYDNFSQNGVVGYARIPGISGSGPVVAVPGAAGASGGGGSGSGGGGSSLWGTIWDGILGGLNLSASSGSGVAQSLEQAGAATDATEQGLFAVAAPLIKIATAIDWLFHPNHWVRIIAGVGGGVLVIGGIWQMSHVGGGDIPISAYGVSTSVSLSPPQAASLPLGIAAVGIGGLLLFVAFHNLPASVTNISTLTGYLSDELTQGSIAAGAQPSGQ